MGGPERGSRKTTNKWGFCSALIVRCAGTSPLCQHKETRKWNYCWPVGLPSLAEPANSLFPSAVLTVDAAARLDPSLAR
jgi:hypothetical protein